MTKKILSSVLCVVMLFLLISDPLEANAALVTMPPVSVQDVTYQYNDRVKFIDLSGISLSGQGMTIPGTALSAGDVLVDEKGQKSLKILKVNADGTYITGQPTMYELFKEFVIPRQVIEPNDANIIEYGVKGIPASDYAAILAAGSGQTGTQKLMSGDVPSADMKNMYDIFNKRGSKIYQYKGDYSWSSFDSDSSKTVNLHVEGAMGVSPGIVTSYSLSGGYEFGFVNAAQFIDLKVLLDVKIEEEMYLPIFEIGIEIPKLGKVMAGVFLVIDIDGDITLTIKAEEGIIATASVYGDTHWGIPTSFHIDKSFEMFYGAECDPMGYIHAGMYITPLVKLEILSIDVFDAQLRLGLYAYADFTETTLNYGIDFVIHAFVVILDEKADLFEEHIPIIQRSKTMRPNDDIIYYTSRLCSYQDRINVSAFTERKSGSTELYPEPFSDKLPFANRALEVWYYKSGNDPQGGANNKPTSVISVATDSNGCVQIDFSFIGVDISKGDCVIIKAPGFIAQTDVIQASNPFLSWGSVWTGGDFLQGDYFEDTVEFQTPSGMDLTKLDVPNSTVKFDVKPRIYYEGPVKVYSTNMTTNVTETAGFYALKGVTEYTLTQTAPNKVYVGAYDIQPKCELKWQINESGYTYGTTVPSGKGGRQTEHNIVVHRVTVDQQFPIEDYYGNPIGLQHNVTLQLIAVNKGGRKPYTGTADLYVALGMVPAGFVQGPFPVRDLGYISFPAADMRYPNHFEYYPDDPFPKILYERTDLPDLVLGSAISSEWGTSTQTAYKWRWEEIKPEIDPTVTVTELYTYQAPTGGYESKWITAEKPNIIYKNPFFYVLDGFLNMQPSYVITSPMAGESAPADLVEASSRDIYQMRHIISGMSVAGIPLEDPPFSPPAPQIFHKEELAHADARAFNIKFQLEQMLANDQYVVNPLTDFAEGGYGAASITKINTSVKAPVTIRNRAALPRWATGYIQAVVDNGIMRLDTSGNFAAGINTTRADFCAAIVNALGLSSLDTVRQGFPFTDVKADNPYFQQMQIAYQCGIINGKSATVFGPGSQITRQDAATMLMRAFNLRNSGLVPEDTAGLLGRFADSGSVSPYALEGMEQSVALGFFRGVSETTLVPRNNITNEQTAKIVWELKLKAEKPGLQWDDASTLR